MAKILLLVSAIILYFVFTPIIHAQTVTPAPQQQWTNEFTVENKPSTIIVLLKNFIEGFDSFMGGFIFYTPDPFGSTIKLKDASEIPGVTKYRDLFYQITIPVLAIIIAAIAISKIGSDDAQAIKSFGMRFLITLVLFVTVPHVLSYSIQFNNLLVERITTTQQFTGFLQDYLDKSAQEISNGEDPEKYGIPSYDISLIGGIFKSLGKFIVQTFLFILTFLFLLGSFVYIGFQFVIRFATLLFLGVLYPIIIPFALAERTQHIVETFFKTWFTFLIQQPAFVLGFAIANDIFMNILNAQGPTVGMLFFYTGFLFFLGGVNMLVGRLFGDAWGMFTTNMQAAIATRATTAPVSTRINDFKRGLTGGSMSYTAGQFLNNRMRKEKIEKSYDDSSSNGSTPTHILSRGKDTDIHPAKSSQPASPFSQVLTNRGLDVKSENQKQGVVKVSGDVYKYDDPKTGLTAYYPTRMEAVQDGAPENKLEKVKLDQNRFIDLSGFHKKNPNPHNYNAMQESRKRGKNMNYAYINELSPPQRIKQFLEVSKERNETYGIQGVIVQRQGNQTSDHIIRMYSYKTNEKRTNL